MKLSKILSAATWYVAFSLIIGFMLVVQVTRMGIEVHWSQLILITALCPFVPTLIIMWLFPSGEYDVAYFHPRGVGDVQQSMSNTQELLIKGNQLCQS